MRYSPHTPIFNKRPRHGNVVVGHQIGPALTQIHPSTVTRPATAIAPDDVEVTNPSPVEFVGAFHVFGNFSDMPDSLDWVPNDYAIVAAWNSLGGTLTLPSWLTRLDGQSATTNPALAGGFLTDGYTEWTYNNSQTDGRYHINIGSSATADNMMFVVGIYRFVDDTVPVDDFVSEVLDDSPLNDVLGPMAVPADGAAVAEVVAQSASSTAFLFDSPAVDRLSTETNSPTNRTLRVADVLGGGANVSFTATTTTGLSAANHAYAVALNPRISPFSATDISFVGAGTSVGVTSGTTLTVPLPSGIQADDLLICCLHFDNNNNSPWSAESGWVGDVLVMPFAGRQQTWFVKRAVGGDSDPTFDAASAGPRKQGIAVAYRNCAGVVFWQTAQGNTLTPARNTYVTNTVVLACGCSEFYQPVTLGTANGYTTRNSRDDTSDGGIHLADKTISSPGAPSFPVFSAPNTDFMTVSMAFLVPPRQP